LRAYILKIELAGSDPLIWRRVVMPMGITSMSSSYQRRTESFRAMKKPTLITRTTRRTRYFLKNG